jgi:hypothetical protein
VSHGEGDQAVRNVDRRVPVRIRIGVPSHGRGQRIDQMRASLDANCAVPMARRWLPAGLHGGAERRESLPAGAQLFLLPPYSPDMNPIEMAFASLKTLLRQVPKRIRDGLWQHIGALLDLFTPGMRQLSPSRQLLRRGFDAGASHGSSDRLTHVAVYTDFAANASPRLRDARRRLGGV